MENWHDSDIEDFSARSDSMLDCTSTNRVFLLPKGLSIEITRSAKCQVTYSSTTDKTYSEFVR
jgi:hypothetical protein